MKKEMIKNIIIIFLIIIIIILTTFIFINKKEKKEKLEENITTTTKITDSFLIEKTIEQTTNKIILKEEDLLNEIEDDYNSLNKDNIKDYFIKIVDFIFYDEPLNGLYFKDLKNKTKITILKYALLIDNKLENIFPNYKETLNEKYNKIKEKLIFEYMNSLTYVCSNNKEECELLSKEFKNLKNNISITWTNIKDAFLTYKEETSYKIEEWYKIFKNS